MFVASSRSVSHIYSVSCFRTSNIVRLFQAGCTLSSHFLIYPGYTPRLDGSRGRHNARTHVTHIRYQEIGIESRKYMKKVSVRTQFPVFQQCSVQNTSFSTKCWALASHSSHVLMGGARGINHEAGSLVTSHLLPPHSYSDNHLPGARGQGLVSHNTMGIPLLIRGWQSQSCASWLPPRRHLLVINLFSESHHYLQLLWICILKLQTSNKVYFYSIVLKPCMIS